MQQTLVMTEHVRRGEKNEQAKHKLLNCSLPDDPGLH